MKYTLRDLLNDLKGFDLDAVIFTVREREKEYDTNENTLFFIENPTPVDGETDWEVSTFS